MLTNDSVGSNRESRAWTVLVMEDRTQDGLNLSLTDQRKNVFTISEVRSCSYRDSLHPPAYQHRFTTELLLAFELKLLQVLIRELRFNVGILRFCLK